jgi:hypothetical protein
MNQSLKHIHCISWSKENFKRERIYLIHLIFKKLVNIPNLDYQSQFVTLTLMIDLRIVKCTSLNPCPTIKYFNHQKKKVILICLFQHLLNSSLLHIEIEWRRYIHVDQQWKCSQGHKPHLLKTQMSLGCLKYQKPISYWKNFIARWPESYKVKAKCEGCIVH